MGWAALSIASFFPPLPLDDSRGWYDLGLGLAVLGGASYGGLRGRHAWEQETRRAFHGLAGFVVFYALDRLLVAAYLLGGPGGKIDLPMASMQVMAPWLGVLLGGLWPAVGQALLRGGIGALLGLYLAGLISFVWPVTNALMEELQLSLLAITAGSIVIPLLSARPARAMTRVVAASLPGLALIRFFYLRPPSGNGLPFFRIALLSALVALPLAGLRYTRLTSSGTGSFSLAGSDLPPSESMRLVRAGVVAAAFVSLVVGLTVWIGSWLTPLVERMVVAVLDFPVVEAFLFNVGITRLRIPVYAAWLAILTIYASIAGVGQLVRRGAMYRLYRFVRLLALVLACCLIAFLAEQAFEAVLTGWSAFRSFGGYLLWMGYGLPVGAMVLGALFAIAYVGDHMPVFLIAVSFAIWLVQVILLSGVLALVGGVVGLWVGPVLGPILDSQGSGGLYGMPWQQALPVAGAYLGFFAALIRSLIRLVSHDPGILVAEFRRVVERYSGLVDARADRLLRLGGPWWATAAFGVAAIWAMRQFVHLMMPALIQRF